MWRSPAVTKVSRRRRWWCIGGSGGRQYFKNNTDDLESGTAETFRQSQVPDIIEIYCRGTNQIYGVSTATIGLVGIECLSPPTRQSGDCGTGPLSRTESSAWCVIFGTTRMSDTTVVEKHVRSSKMMSGRETKQRAAIVSQIVHVWFLLTTLRYKELMEDPNISNFKTLPAHGSLIHWVKQGVLLLNAVMTVRKKEPNSHQNKGWENVTDEIIRAVLMFHCTRTSDRSTDALLDSDVTTTTTATTNATTTATSTPNGRGCVFLLWGKPATKKAMNVIESVMKGQQKSTHAIICTSHPSPLGARKTSTPFLGSHCFSRCNAELIAMGHDPIDWTVWCSNVGLDAGPQ